MVYLLIHYTLFLLVYSRLYLISSNYQNKSRVSVVLFSNVITIYIVVLCTLSVTVAILAQGTPWGDALCAALL